MVPPTNHMQSFIIQLLIYDYNDRMTWDELFKCDINFNQVNTNINNIAINNQYKSCKSQSVIIPRSNNIPINMVKSPKNDESDDYRIFSKSAPKHISSSYFENYIKNKDIVDNTLPILGSSPESRKSLNNILDKSIGTLKHFLYK